MYVYIQSEPELWTVGFYHPDGQWVPDSDHESSASATNRVRYLNGGSQAIERTNPPKPGAMTIKEAYAILWEKLPRANVISIVIETTANRDKPAEVEYSLYVGTADGCFNVESRQSLEVGVADLLRKINGDEPAPADLNAIQDQVSEL